MTIDNFNKKMMKLKNELEHDRAETQKLKASNDNMIFVNEKLNKAYSKLVLKLEEKKLND